MKTYKLIDLWGNLAIILPIIMVSIYRIDASVLFVFYWLIGGWHLLSCIVHFVLKPKYIASPLRKVYEAILLMIIFLVVICWGFEALQVDNPLWYALALGGIFISPFLAIFYVILCYKEVYTYNVRPLSILKY